MPSDIALRGDLGEHGGPQTRSEVRVARRSISDNMSLDARAARSDRKEARPRPVALGGRGISEGPPRPGTPPSADGGAMTRVDGDLEKVRRSTPSRAVSGFRLRRAIVAWAFMVGGIVSNDVVAKLWSGRAWFETALAIGVAAAGNLFAIAYATFVAPSFRHLFARLDKASIRHASATNGAEATAISISAAVAEVAIYLVPTVALLSVAFRTILFNEAERGGLLTRGVLAVLFVLSLGLVAECERIVCRLALRQAGLVAVMRQSIRTEACTSLVAAAAIVLTVRPP